MRSDEAFQVVPMNVARNPVARAINAARLQRAVRDFRALRLALLLDGDNAGGDVLVCSQLVTVCLFAVQRAGFGSTEAAAILHRGQAALLECSNRGFAWRCADTPAIDAALLCALDLYPQLDARTVAQAWKDVQRIEEDAGLKAAHPQENAR